MRKFAALQIAQHQFDRFEVVKVGWRWFGDQPVTLTLEDRGDVQAAVRRKLVPDVRRIVISQQLA